MRLSIEEGSEGYRVAARFPDGDIIHGEWFPTREEAEGDLEVCSQPLIVVGTVVELGPGIWIGCARLSQGEETCELPPVGPFEDEPTAQHALNHAVQAAGALLGMQTHKAPSWPAS